MCELASLYTLQAMGKAQQTNPPCHNCKGHAGLTDHAARAVIWDASDAGRRSR